MTFMFLLLFVVGIAMVFLGGILFDDDALLKAIVCGIVGLGVLVLVGFLFGDIIQKGYPVRALERTLDEAGLYKTESVAIYGKEYLTLLSKPLEEDSTPRLYRFSDKLIVGETYRASFVGVGNAGTELRMTIWHTPTSVVEAKPEK